MIDGKGIYRCDTEFQRRTPPGEPFQWKTCLKKAKYSYRTPFRTDDWHCCERHKPEHNDTLTPVTGKFIPMFPTEKEFRRNEQG